MKILFINSVYNEKSTGNLVKKIAEYCKSNNNEVLTIYGRGRKKKEKCAIKTQPSILFLFNVLLSRVSGYFFKKGNAYSTYKIIKIIKKYKPDCINIHQLYGYYLNPKKILNFLKQSKIPVIITMHDFTLFSGKCGYPLSCDKYKNICFDCPRLKEYPSSLFFDNVKDEFFEKNNIISNSGFYFVAVSDWLNLQAKSSTILKDQKVMTINNGIDSSYFSFAKNISRKDNTILVVSTNFKDKIKGAEFLISTINKIYEKKADINFIIVGKNSKFIRKNLSFSKNISFYDYISKEELSNLYSTSSCVFLSSSSETFSLPTAEALCCGTPVFGAKGSGAPEFLLDDKYCDFSTERNPDEMADFLLNNINKITREESYNLSKKALKKFEISKMLQSYLELYKNVTINL